jgi:hypothetical protein
VPLLSHCTSTHSFKSPTLLSSPDPHQLEVNFKFIKLTCFSQVSVCHCLSCYLTTYCSHNPSRQHRLFRPYCYVDNKIWYARRFPKAKLSNNIVFRRHPPVTVAHVSSQELARSPPLIPPYRQRSYGKPFSLFGLHIFGVLSRPLRIAAC